MYFNVRMSHSSHDLRWSHLGHNFIYQHFIFTVLCRYIAVVLLLVVVVPMLNKMSSYLIMSLYT